MSALPPWMLRLLRLSAMALAGWLAVVTELAPFRISAGALPTAPDLLFCLFAAIALRRPQAAPAPLIFALGLARDLVSGGPVGPGALGLTLSISLLGAFAPYLARRAAPIRWMAAALAFGAGLALSAALLLASFSASPPLETLAMRWGATAMIYPLAALAAQLLLRIAPRSETDLGQLSNARRA